MGELRQNPFRDHGEWYWWDDQERWHGPYPDQISALRGLCDFLAPTRWQKFVRLVKEFIHS